MTPSIGDIENIIPPMKKRIFRLARSTFGFPIIYLSVVLLAKKGSIIEKQNVLCANLNIHFFMGGMMFSMSPTDGAMIWQQKLFNFQKWSFIPAPY